MDVWFDMDMDRNWLSDSFECIADPAGEKPVVYAEQVLRKSERWPRRAIMPTAATTRLFALRMHL